VSVDLLQMPELQLKGGVRTTPQQCPVGMEFGLSLSGSTLFPGGASNLEQQGVSLLTAVRPVLLAHQQC